MNNQFKRLGGIILIVSLAAFNACSDSGRDLESKRYDSLFLGISIGMERQAFFDRCWELNHQRLVEQGPTNTKVQYIFDSLLNDQVIMRFYPNFYQDKIYEMPVIYTYQAWAPWNRQFSADTLLKNMVPIFKRWYGDDFQVIDHKTMGKIYARIDGKRRINLFKKDDQYIQAVYTDLRIAKKLKDEAENKDN